MARGGVVRRIVLGVAAWLLASIPAIAGCDATPPVPASLASAESVADYAPTLKLCRKDGETRDSKLVFIGRNLPEERIRKGFEDCFA